MQGCATLPGGCQQQYQAIGAVFARQRANAENDVQQHKRRGCERADQQCFDRQLPTERGLYTEEDDKKREEQTTGALAKAREQTEAAEARTREYEQAFQSARQEVYRQREADRQVANKERAETLQRAREQSDATVHAAQFELEAQVEAAKKDLGPASQTLAREIVEVVLGNKPSSFTPGGARP